MLLVEISTKNSNHCKRVQKIRRFRQKNIDILKNIDRLKQFFFTDFNILNNCNYFSTMHSSEQIQSGRSRRHYKTSLLRRHSSAAYSIDNSKL